MSDDASRPGRKATDRGRHGGDDSSLVSLRPFVRSLPMELLKAREAVMERFRPILREHGITEQQWRVLRALEGADSLSLSELATATYIRLPSLSRIVPGLVERKLVTRQTKADDQRTTLVSLARAGRRLLEHVGPQSETEYRRIGERLGRAQFELLYEMLAALQGPD